MLKIFHITPHLGGGVGAVLLNWLSYDKGNSHTIASLDTANQKSLEVCRKNNIEIFSKMPHTLILSKIQEADITVIHFWNHPLLYDFLIREELPPARVIFWAHIKGETPPYVFNDKLFEYADEFIFTTPLSGKYVPKGKRYQTITSTSGIEKFCTIKKQPHDNYVAGYVGTVDYAKMHPEFVSVLSKTNADNIIVTGGDKEKEIAKGADSRFVFTGKVVNPEEIYSQLDVFTYLLNPNHYGTAEQVIQEALACGLPIVVLNNECEKSLVVHNQTGLIANDLNEFVEYVNKLKTDLPLRERLSGNARKYAMENFSLKHLAEEWNGVFEKIIQKAKTPKHWEKDKPQYDSFDVFLESLGSCANIFLNKSDEELSEILKQTNWSSENKGTPKQYFSYLKGERLAKLLTLY